MGAPRIFISYRRDDTVGHAGRLFDRLADQNGKENVFRDIEAIGVGEDFVEAVRKKIAESDVLIALIGPRWLTAADEQGRWRLADENDLVRVEIASALDSKIRVVPVLVQGAAMPKAKDLPGELVRLAQRNAFEIRDTSFDRDVAQLVDALGPTWRHKLIRAFARRPVYAGIAVFAAVLLGLWLYPKIALTPDDARVRITQMGLTYDADTFVDKAAADDQQVVNLFLRAGMQPDAKNEREETALMWAAAEGHLQLVKTLLDKGANADAALPRAAGSGQRDILDLLLARKPGRAAISSALVRAGGSEPDIAQKLIDLGADVEFQHDGRTPLTSAAGSLNLEVVRLLLARGANPNAYAGESTTPLTAALWSSGDADPERRIQVVRALLDRGADLELRMRSMVTWQPTPLLLAIDRGKSQIALLLIERGADVNARTGDTGNGKTQTALMWAARERQKDVVPSLLAHGADFRVRNELGVTALDAAAEGGDPEIVEALMAAGADVNVRTNTGKTPLMRAAVHGRTEAAGALVAGGAHANDADQDGWTALMFAVRDGDRDTVELLIRSGADPTAANGDGETALSIATRRQDKDMLKLLKTPSERAPGTGRAG